MKFKTKGDCQSRARKIIPVLFCFNSTWGTLCRWATQSDCVHSNSTWLGNTIQIKLQESMHPALPASKWGKRERTSAFWFNSWSFGTAACCLSALQGRTHFLSETQPPEVHQSQLSAGGRKGGFSAVRWVTLSERKMCQGAENLWNLTEAFSHQKRARTNAW